MAQGNDRVALNPRLAVGAEEAAVFPVDEFPAKAD